MGRRMDIFLVDGRLLVASDVEQREIDLSLFVAEGNDGSAGACHGSPAGFWIQPSTRVMEIRRIEVRRDIYLRTTHRDGAGCEDFGRVPAKHYFVVGDNLPVSVDSRNGLGCVPASRVVGIVGRGERGER